jgi:hypothetical protein
MMCFSDCKTTVASTGRDVCDLEQENQMLRQKISLLEHKIKSKD